MEFQVGSFDVVKVVVDGVVKDCWFVVIIVGVYDSIQVMMVQLEG